MKRFCLASAMVFAAALLAQPATAADYRGPRHVGPRHVKAHPVHPKQAYYHGLKQRGWTCNEHGNCEPNWGWGKDVGAARVAAVIVARGDIPLYERLDRFQACQAPRLMWTGWRWLKVWDQNCVR